MTKIYQNKVLGLTAKSIPYVKELRPVAGSVTAAILWQQLEYWFMQKNYSCFYKFTAPCEHELYRQGDSWTEELGFSPDEFRTAFDKIGIRYESSAAFNKVLSENNQDIKMAFFDKDGNHKMYISVYDRIKKTTEYYRNDELINSTLDTIFTQDPPPPLLRKPTIPSYVNQESRFTVNRQSPVLYTENTNTDITTDNIISFFLPLNYICLNFEEARARAQEIPKDIHDRIFKSWHEHHVVVDLSFLGIFKPLQIVSHAKLSKVTVNEFEGLKTHYNSLKQVSDFSAPEIGGWDYFQIVNQKFTELHAEYSRSTQSESHVMKSHQQVMDWLKNNS